MAQRTVWLAAFTVIFFAVLVASGSYILYVSEIQPPEDPAALLRGWPKIIFGLHLALWMLLGMMFNYVWDLFRSGKSWPDITWRELLLPTLVSPIVFFTIWSIWKGDPINFALVLIAFQNGFFWQVVFSKAGPI